MVSHKDSTLYTTHKKLVAKMLVAGKCSNLGVTGPGEKPSREETRSSGTDGSHPGQDSWSVSRGDTHIPQSLGTKGNQEGTLLGRVQTR